MASIEERVKNVIVESLSVDAEKVTPEASFVDDLDADSLDQVELILALEEEFGCQIPEEEASKITTVGEAIGYLKKNIKE
ncbi:MAG: acyl carrier protein [candidate division Zixibacteria bacterium]|jgi:acyl carrier protein|nr:acyl carrier protein [candidate division Zixibacteria bacterium]